VSAAFVRLVLASGSPRRHELLGRLLAHEVQPPTVGESQLPGEAADHYVVRLAREKAMSVAATNRDCVVLAADTAVLLDGEILGKPAGADDARRMLRSLSGRAHEVLTAMHLVFAEREASHLERATVRFMPLGTEIIEWYVASGEPTDKAGAYAVQGLGAVLVRGLEGNVQAVVGLPLSPLPSLFAAVGLELRRSDAALALSRRA
jgi:nucleoside triphosphate pyrophosphatase